MVRHWIVLRLAAEKALSYLPVWLCRREEILGSTRQAIMRAIIILLSLGVCACCAYGMSQIDPQLVSKGLSVINSLKVCCILTCGLHASSQRACGVF